MNRGLLSYQEQEFESAIVDFTKAIECDPTIPAGYLHRAQCYDTQDQRELAAQDFDLAVQLGPEWPQAWCARGAFRSRCENMEGARTDLNRAIELAPDFAEALFRRSQVLVRLQELDLALADLDRLIELMPDLTAAYSGRASVWLLKGNRERADADVEAVIQQQPEAAEGIRLHQDLVEISFHVNHERFDEAIEVANKVIEARPDCGPAYRMRAGAYWYSEQFVEAADDYTWIIEQAAEPATEQVEGHENADCYSARGQIWAELGEYELALRDLDEALRRVAGADLVTLEAYIRNGRGLALAGLGRQAEAGAEFNQSIAACPRNAWVQFNLGLSYVGQGESASAAECFRLALELDGPCLTPRKRSRAKAFLAKLKDGRREG